MAKGISPIVASVLLIAFVIGIAAMVGQFFPSLMDDLTESTTDSTSTLSDSSDRRLSVERVLYNKPKEKIDVSFQNRGANISSNITTTIYCGNELFQERTEGLLKGEIKTVSSNINGCSQVDRVRVSSQKYSVHDETDEIRVKESLEWKLSAGRFEEKASIVTDLIFEPLRLAQEMGSETEKDTFSGSKTNLTLEDGQLSLKQE